MKKLGILLPLLLAAAFVHAQLPQKWVHTGISMVSYKGDLSEYDQYSAAFHVGIQFNKKKRLNGGFNLGFGSVSGENRTFTTTVPDKTPNRFFKSTYFYANYDLHINLIKKDNYIVYLSQGIGFIRFTPTDQFGEDLLEQNNTRADNETYRNASIMLPTKLGAMYYLPNDFGIGLQAGFYGTMTDYLDNISELGESGNDNILEYRMSLYVPLY
ncbi:MAG: hypothetical protein ABJH05_01740 [Fulvivirga sp.]